MKNRWLAGVLAAAIATTALVAVAEPAHAAALTSADFLKVSGNVLKKAPAQEPRSISAARTSAGG